MAVIYVMTHNTDGNKHTVHGITNNDAEATAWENATEDACIIELDAGSSPSFDPALPRERS